MAGLDSGSSENIYRGAGNDCESGFSSPENTRAVNEFQGESNDICSTGSPSILSSPRMVHNPFAVKVDTPTRSMADSTDHKEFRPILAPATLVLGKCGSDTETVLNSVSSSFRLKPPLLNNPFLKIDTASSGDKKLENSEVSTTSENAECMYPDTGQELESSSSGAVRAAEGALRKTSLVVPPSPRDIALNTQHTEDEQLAERNSEDESMSSNFKDMPPPPQPPSMLSQSHMSSFSPNLASGPPVQSGGFVFGQNMDARVVNAKSRQCIVNGTAGLFPKSPESEDEDEEGLFRGSKGFVESQQHENNFDTMSVERQIKSLTESAQEYEARQVKRTYEEVAIVTGEEDESNVLQMNCKLFAFDKVNASWTEKGRCLLRLNDKETEDSTIHSRLVARTQGSLRVVLNTKVWGGMSVDRPSPTSVRLTVMDGETVRVFLVSGSTKDIDLLFGALDWRITTLKTSEDRRNMGEGCSSSMSVGSSTCGALADETISSSGTSPASPVDMASTSGTECYQSVSTSLLSAETVVGTKKRRISPPSGPDEDVSGGDDSCLPESFVVDSQVQERIVDSTDNNDSNSADGKLN